MYRYKFLNLILSVMVVFSMVAGGSSQMPVTASVPSKANNSAQAQSTLANNPLINDELGNTTTPARLRTTTMAMREAAASRRISLSGTVNKIFAGLSSVTNAISPLAARAAELFSMAPPNSAPDYFGIANWANSPLPQLDTNGNLVPGTGMRKFVDTLPGICGVSPSSTNNLGQCIPAAIPDTKTFPGSDYYEIALVEFREQMHSDLPTAGTKIRGYVQVVDASFPNAVPLTTANGLTMNITDRAGNQVYGAYKPHYLGPMIIAQGCELSSPGCTPRPVRVKFDNYLPTGVDGDLFIPVDTSYMGAGVGPGGSIRSVTITNGGAGYKTAPNVVFTNAPGDTTGTGAAATATVINGKITAVLVTNGGSGYIAAPLVSFTGGSPTTVAVAASVLAGQPGEMYSQNRATLHLHGGNTPWISDGTPHQWTVPAGEITSYKKGESVGYVPDMWFDSLGNLISSCAGLTSCAVAGASNDPGPGKLDFYWTNQESGRLLFYHDHSYGITRLNVYAGEAAGYLIVDPAEENALAAAGIPGTLGTANDLAHMIPLVIQDKTYVPDDGQNGGQLAATDPTWDLAKYGGLGNFWAPHVWMPNQNPADISGANAYGRWDYGPWFWPPQDPSTFVAGGLPYKCDSSFYNAPNPPPAFPPLMCPGIPTPSGVMEAMLDTPVVNGTAYPTLTVDPTAYRFQILMAGNDRSWNLGLYVAEPLSVAVTNGGANYTLPPKVVFTGGGGSGAVAVAEMSNGSITSVIPTNAGKGYTVVPNVTVTGNGIGAVITAVIDPITHSILSYNIIDGGSGYTSATLTVDPPLGCTGGSTNCATATANAVVTPAGVIVGVNVTNYGSGWTSAPTVSFQNAPGDITGFGAVAVASINSEVRMVAAEPHNEADDIPLCTTATRTSGAQLALATLDGNGNPINGTGYQAGCWPTTWPTDGRDGGVPDPLTVGPPIIQIGTESGLLPNPVVIPSTPVSYEYNRKSITVLNVFQHGLYIGPAERADVVVDFSQFAGKTLILYNDAPAPNPAFDPREDYYTGDPDQTSTGGAPSTLPGYGPNTRTVMQIKVSAVTSGSTSTVSSVTVNNGGSGFKAPSVNITGGGGTGAAGTAFGSVTAVALTSAGSGYTNPIVTFTNAAGDTTGSGASAVFGQGLVSGLTLTAPGAGYSVAPTVSFIGGGGANASAKATVSVTNIALGSGGSGYSAAPGVTITDPTGAGTGATASATVSVTGVNYTPGVGYQSAPTVQIADTGTGSGASASATVSITGTLLLNGGSNYTAPTVQLVDLGGTGVGATYAYTVTAGAFTGFKILTPGSHYTTPVVQITDSTGSGANIVTLGAVDGVTVTPGAKYTAPTVTFTGGNPTVAATGSTAGAVDSLTLTGVGAKYTAPQVNFSGSGTGATASTTGVVDSLTLTAPGSGYTSAPAVTLSAPPAGGTQATATATIATTGIVLTNGGSGYTAAPVVTISDNGGSGTGAQAVATLSISSITLNSSGTGYTSVPAVSIVDTNGGTGSGAAATANMAAISALQLAPIAAGLPNVFAQFQNKMIIPQPIFPAGNGGATQSTYVRIQDTSITAWAGGPVGGLTLTAGGSGYASAPDVQFTGGGGTGATAAVTFVGANVTGLTLLNGGAGYSSAPTVQFNGGGGSNAAATAIFRGSVGSIAVTQSGSNYRNMPAVIIGAPLAGGTQATATASGSVSAINLVNGGSGYTSAPQVTLSAPPAGGTQATATATISTVTHQVTGFTITNQGSGYIAAPQVTITGGGGSNASATSRLKVTAVKVTNGGSNYATPPSVTFNNTNTGGSGAVATATLSGSVVQLLLTNGGSGYTSAPTVSFTGGGTPTTAASATATFTPGTITNITLTNGGTGYTSAPTVSFINGGTPAIPAVAVATPPVSSLEPKAIQELFTLDYGRMNATMGVEVPFTNFFVQTTIPYGYIDPPTEMFKNGDTAFWKITHNGVDTHFIHFHLFDVQVINRVGWDGAIKPPDDNEVAWKDTVRMNPLEDVIIALRPMKQVLPWELPNSVRPLDVTQSIGASNANNTPGFSNIDPNNQPAPVINALVNFGWEYVWHCHILEHEEIDMMRPVLFAIAPDAPDTLLITPTIVLNRQAVLLTWFDRSINETGFSVQRATSMNGPWFTLTPVAPAAPGTGTKMSYTDTSIARRTTYYYRVIANNVVGYAQTFAAPASGYPTISADSAPAYAPASITTQNLTSNSLSIFSDSFETGLNQWSGFVGSLQADAKAVVGPYGGKLGLAATIGAADQQQAAYTYDLSTKAETMYDASFYFNPNNALTGASPVDIFTGLDQNGQPTFGVQYQSDAAGAFQFRAWVMQDGYQVFTAWKQYALDEGEEEDVTNATHKVEIAWLSGTHGGLSLYIDDALFTTLSGNTSAYQVSEVLLGPSLGLTSSASGTMYFDEFTSNRLSGIQYSLFMPIISAVNNK